jgi:pimeloyl-ACP methyl ester carboxylesterase
MSRFTTSGGSTIWYEDSGSGPVLLALPGVGGGPYFFRGLADRLGGSLRIIAIDYPGIGLSTAGPGRFSIDGWVHDLEEFVRAIDAAPLVMLGHSLGTIVALSAWARWPALIRGLIFVGGLPEVRPGIREKLLERGRFIDRDGMAGWGRRVSPAVFAAKTIAEQPETVGLFERAFDFQPADSYVRSLQVLTSASASSVVPRVTVPCCSISGAEDLYAPPDAVRAFLDAFPQRPTQVVLPGVAHMPFFEAPEAFAAAVAQWVERMAQRSDSS